MTELIGYFAAALTTAAFIPQVYKTYKHKRADDLSLSMYIAFSLGISLWFIYGLIQMDPPIIYANAVTLILALSVIYMKIIYTKKRKRNVKG